jgi:hypothetical protein
VVDERTPVPLREGVRAGILAVLTRDVELRGGRTARLLAAAGAIGILGAVGTTLMLSGHPYGHHPSWHVVVFSAMWAGLLVVSLSLVLLRVRTPSLPLARAASVGLLGLGAAGICGALCPDPHFLAWWSGTAVGGALARAGGLAMSALCFGLVTTAFFGAASALLLLGGRGHPSVRPFLPAVALIALLAPGVALQSVGTSWGVFASWLAGTAAGAYTGIAGALRLRLLLDPR